MAYDFSGFDFNNRGGACGTRSVASPVVREERDINSNNTGVYVTPLYGNRLGDNKVPNLDVRLYGRPFISIENPVDGSKFPFSREMLSYGLMAIGSPGSGKTNLFNLIMHPLLLTRNDKDIVVIFDSKGDFYREFAATIPKEEIIVIGAGEEYENVTSYYNLFGEIMPRARDGRLVYTPQSDELAKEIASQFFKKMKSDSQPVFPAMAEQIFAGVIIYFMRSYWMQHPEKLNNKDLSGFLLSSSNETLKQIFSSNYMRDYAHLITYIDGKNNMTQGVSAYVGTVLGKLFVGPFANSAPGREFSMREVIKSRKKKVIFIEYDLTRGALLEPVYGVMIDRALKSALGGRETDRANVYFLLDEMLLLPEIESLPAALNYGRSQGVKMICGIQNTAGLEDMYGEAGLRNTLGSFQNMVVFSTTDYETRKFVVDRMGANYVSIAYSSQQSNLTVQREGHTVEEWDLLNLGFGEAIVSLRFQKPFKFHMPQYK